MNENEFLSQLKATMNGVGTFCVISSYPFHNTTTALANSS